MSERAKTVAVCLACYLAGCMLVLMPPETRLVAAASEAILIAYVVWHAQEKSA